MPETSTGTSATTYTLDTVDCRIERAHELCVDALKDCPSGNIPVQTVYEILLDIIGRKDIADAMREEGNRLWDEHGDEGDAA